MRVEGRGRARRREGREGRGQGPVGRGERHVWGFVVDQLGVQSHLPWTAFMIEHKLRRYLRWDALEKRYSRILMI